MLTIFTIPKPFKDPHINIIQRNAIQSWCRLEPKCEIILFGNDYGIKEVAEEFGLINIGDIKKNEFGTPLLDFVFEKAQQIASKDILCYVNADIILTSNFISIIEQINLKKFLLIGKRCNKDIDYELDFDSAYTENQLIELANKNGYIESEWAIDYFVFNKGLINKMPAFAVGRAGWDNWFIYNARRRRIPVVDITKSTFVIHQNHNYNHIQRKKGIKYEGPESDMNLSIIGGGPNHIYYWNIKNANWILDNNQLIRNHFKLSIRMYQLLVLTLPEKLHILINILLYFRQKIKGN